MDTEYDLIVMGAGSTGENVADRAVQGGLTVVIVEDELVGGECSYWACMPSKALLRSGEALRAAQAVPGAADAVTGALDVTAVLARRDSFTSNWSDDSQADWLKNAGIDLVRGRGRIAGEREVTVAEPNGHQRVLRARHAVAICTGSVANVADIPGLRDATPWTSRDATSVKEIPETLAIIGGGVVGVEMATAFTDLGSAVTIISRGRLLEGMEPFAGDAVVDRLRERGVQVLLETQTTSVSRGADGVVTVETDSGETVRVSEVLAATGRKAGTDGLGLAAIGLEDGDWLNVDDTMLVEGFDWLYAVGDVNHRVLLTHQGKYQARAAGDVIAARAVGAAVDDAAWGVHVATADHDSVPQVIFADPEVASVGLTSERAEKAGMSVRVVDTPIGGVAGAALLMDGYEGTARMVVDEDRGVVVGMTFAGPAVSELLHAATVAVVGQVPVERLWHAVPSYPSVSEVWLRLLEAYGRPATAR
ncbi:dihydrolipoyl dehydrogenase family protein [Tessaracoccus sp.]